MSILRYLVCGYLILLYYIETTVEVYNLVYFLVILAKMISYH